jgi:hypothetical protein
MIRFIEASPEAYEVMNTIIDKHFPELREATIKILFDTKKKVNGGKIVLGQMSKANDLVRRLTDNLADEGCDYIMFLDQIAFENIPVDDKVRLVRHELRHCQVHDTDVKRVFNLAPHDIEDFRVEVELNKDNVGWAENAVTLVSDIYDQMAEAEKEKKGEN